MIEGQDQNSEEERTEKIQHPFAKAISASLIAIGFFFARMLSNKEQDVIIDSELWTALAVCLTISAAAFTYCYVGHFKSKKSANTVLSIFLGILALGMIAFVFSISYEYY